MRSALKTLCLLLLQLHCAIAFAHEGHEHTAEKAVVLSEGSFSAESRSEKYEILVRYGHLEPGKESSFSLFLSNDKSNAPVHASALKISNKDNPSQVFKITEQDSGIYEVSSIFPDKKTYSLDISVSSEIGADLIRVIGIETGKEHADASKKPDWFSYEHILILIGTLLIGLLIGYFIRRKGAKALSLLIIFTFNASPVNTLMAHEGHDHAGEAKNKSENMSSEFAVPKETQFLFHMLTEKVETRDYQPAVSLSGTVIPSSSGNAVLQSPQNATIRSLHVKVGETVRKGQLLLVLEQNIDAATKVDWLMQKNTLDAELVAARKEYERQKSIEDIGARKELDEAERRYKTALANKKEFDKLYAGAGSSSYFSLYAPISGTVQNFTWAIGSNVNAGQEIMTVTDLTKVYVEAQAFGKDIGRILSGDVSLECNGRDFKSSRVRLLSSGQTFNSSNQSQRVIFEVDNEGNNFKIGEFVNVRALSKNAVRTISLPNSAISELNGKVLVFIKETAEKYSLRYIETGENNGEFTTVKSGLKELEKVIVNGSYQMKMIYQNQ